MSPIRQHLAALLFAVSAGFSNLGQPFVTLSYHLGGGLDGAQPARLLMLIGEALMWPGEPFARLGWKLTPPGTPETP